MDNIWLKSLMTYEKWAKYLSERFDDFQELRNKQEFYQHYVDQWNEEWRPNNENI